MSGSVQKAAEAAVISKLGRQCGSSALPKCRSRVLSFAIFFFIVSSSAASAQVDRLTITRPIVPQARVNHAIVKISVAEGDRDSLSELGTKVRLGHPAIRK
jgi:hypothetical protein